jgi:hypothetical protein
MAPFRTQLNLRSEEKNTFPTQYEGFWKKAKKNIKAADCELAKITFLHAAQARSGAKSRFRNVNLNSLERSINLINLLIHPNDPMLHRIFEEIKQEKLSKNPQYDKIKLIEESVIIQIFDNSIAILELDLDLSDIFSSLKSDEIPGCLDELQEFGVTLGEQLCQKLYNARFKPFIQKLSRLPHASQFLNLNLMNDKLALKNEILTRAGETKQLIVKVNWVTRSLLFEPTDRKNDEEVIDHWLKDSGDSDLVKTVKKDKKACAIKWLNYLFREESFRREKTTQDTIDYEVPFCDRWEAMLFSQYYYAAFEAINDSLHTTLSESYINKNIGKGKKSLMKELNRRLENDLIATNLTILEYHNNFGYYKRDVSNYMKEIMKNWEFEEAILDLVKEKTELCEQRMDKLHQKASAKSALYSDLLLLGIAVTSVVAFMFQVIEYGRTISHNADLAVYESNSFNVVKLVSERPTDFVVSLSLIIIILLFIGYYFFRRIQVLD